VTVEVRPIEVPTREKTVADVLRHAARIIEERGWSQYSRERDTGAVCVTGAFEYAYVGRLVDEQDAEDPLWCSVYRECSPYNHPILQVFAKFVGVHEAYAWNDLAERTAEEVTFALRAAADAWEQSRV
jgi:hypothetical protein